MRSIDSFYNNLREPDKSCLEALRFLILKHDAAISEEMKYGMPFFILNKKMLCYFWIDKKSKLPYIGFKEGKLLNLPWLELGDRSTISVMYIDPYADLPLKKLRQTLNSCIELLGKKTAAKAIKKTITKPAKKQA